MNNFITVGLRALYSDRKPVEMYKSFCDAFTSSGFASASVTAFYIILYDGIRCTVNMKA